MNNLSVFVFFFSLEYKNTGIQEYETSLFGGIQEYGNTRIQDVTLVRGGFVPCQHNYRLVFVSSCLLVFFFWGEYKNTGIQEYETLVLLAGIAMPSAHKNIRLVFLFSCLLVFHHSVSSSSFLLNSIKDRLATCRAERGRAMLRRCRCSRQCLDGRVNV